MQGQHIRLSEAREVLEPRMPTLANSLRLSVSAWNVRPESWQVSLDAKARGIFLNRQWHHGVQEALVDDSGIRRESNKGGESYFVLDDSFALRFKHLNNGLMSRNYPTRRAKQWEYQLKMPGLPPWDRLEFGYRMDISGTSIKDAFILLRKAKNFLWIWQVMGERIDTFPVQGTLSLSQTTEPEEFRAYSDYGP